MSYCTLYSNVHQFQVIPEVLESEAHAAANIPAVDLVSNISITIKPTLVSDGTEVSGFNSFRD